MEISVESGLFAVLGTVAFFGGIALLMWIDYRSKIAQRQLEHIERLRSLELGRELPDAEVARASAEASGAWAAAIVGLLVPLFLAGVGVGATAVVLAKAAEQIHLPVLCTIWGVVGLVCIVALSTSMSALRRRKRAEASSSPRESSFTEMPTEPSLDPKKIDLELVNK